MLHLVHAAARAAFRVRALVPAPVLNPASVTTIAGALVVIAAPAAPRSCALVRAPVPASLVPAAITTIAGVLVVIAAPVPLPGLLRTRKDRSAGLGADRHERRVGGRGGVVDL